MSSPLKALQASQLSLDQLQSQGKGKVGREARARGGGVGPSALPLLLPYPTLPYPTLPYPTLPYPPPLHPHLKQKTPHVVLMHNAQSTPTALRVLCRCGRVCGVGLLPVWLGRGHLDWVHGARIA
jgi:hypothetical protein